MFGGMPAYLINVAYPAQAVKNTVGAVVRVIDAPAAFLFFAMLGMWLMLLMVGVNPWVGIVAALAYGLSTYLLLIIGAGHVTKSWALVYAPLMMGGIYCTLRRNPWIGGAATALFASLQIGVNHPQITYYFLMAAALFWLSEGFSPFAGSGCATLRSARPCCLRQGCWPWGRTFLLCGTLSSIPAIRSAAVRSWPQPINRTALRDSIWSMRPPGAMARRRAGTC